MSGPENLTASGMWQRYLPAVDVLVPCLSDEQREMRARLMLARDMALGRMREASADSWQIWNSIHDIASRWAFTAATLDQLETVRRALVRCAMQANALEFREWADADI
jgi:hypothetical protein